MSDTVIPEAIDVTTRAERDRVLGILEKYTRGALRTWPYSAEVVGVLQDLADKVGGREARAKLVQLTVDEDTAMRKGGS
jgi:hypothetical protein